MNNHQESETNQKVAPGNMDSKNSDDAKIIDFLALTPGKLDAVGMVSQCLRKYDSSTLALVKEYLQEQGVFIRELSDGLILIHQVSDPMVTVILNAGLGELPEFLTSEDRQVRLLAKWRLDTLVEHLVNEHN